MNVSRDEMIKAIKTQDSFTPSFDFMSDSEVEKMYRKKLLTEDNPAGNTRSDDLWNVIFNYADSRDIGFLESIGALGYLKQILSADKFNEEDFLNIIEPFDNLSYDLDYFNEFYLFGGENRPKRELSLDDISIIKKISKDLGIPPEKYLIFNNFPYTAYAVRMGVINVYGDIFPSETSLFFTDKVSARIVLAHEWGHVRVLRFGFREDSRVEEFAASLSASFSGLKLSKTERRYLKVHAVCKLFRRDFKMSLIESKLGRCDRNVEN